MFSITEAVDNYISSVTEDREPDGKWHPSSMFGCTRQAIYQVRGITPTEATDAISKRRFYIGHRLHEAVQRAVESAKDVRQVYPEFRIDVPERGVVGHGDILVELSSGKWIVVEVKSIKKMGMRMGLPKEQHVSQAMIYAWAVKNYGCFIVIDGAEVYFPPLGDLLLGVHMVYVEKEDLTIAEIPLDYQPDWDESVEERLDLLELYRGDPDSLPPRLPAGAKGKVHWMCNYCAFRTKCYDVDRSEVKPKGEF